MIRRLVVCGRAGTDVVLTAAIALNFFDYAFVLWVGLWVLRNTWYMEGLGLVPDEFTVHDPSAWVRSIVMTARLCKVLGPSARNEHRQAILFDIMLLILRSVLLS